MLCYAPISDEWLRDLILQLPDLKFLSISCCYKLKSIEISSSCLEELDLCECIDCNWIELKIDTPNLRSLSYRGTVLLLSSNASALSKINLHFLSRNVETQKYIKFLANFHHFSEVLDLEIVKSEVCINEYSFKFTYKKQPICEGETASCCKSLPIKCWCRCMEAVNVEFNEVSNIIRTFVYGKAIDISGG
ncbi:hypothetical protein EZV62_025301 [Acer yangbiense]|uniref:FBD domain-containing protein n=1 Tax=Acer yangbiense TaxID=1000413 RepID=A0A5C7GZH3_9ROSI|nr:hypothetical protein EZV62_025301 [Acer yangbiense]